jgi:hypothetical protein
MLGFFFGLLEFALVWKIDFGQRTYWSYLYVPGFILVLSFITGWYSLVQTTHCQPREPQYLHATRIYGGRDDDDD